MANEENRALAANVVELVRTSTPDALEIEGEPLQEASVRDSGTMPHPSRCATVVQSLLVSVPPHANAGDLVKFAFGSGGQELTARVPLDFESGQSFTVQLLDDGVVCTPHTVTVPTEKGPGDVITARRADGVAHAVRVPENATSGGTFTVFLPDATAFVCEAPKLLDDVTLEPWLVAARNFEMNSDFEVSAPRGCNLQDLISSMKTESAAKRTIQALGDKIILNKMLRNIGVPQMPLVLEIAAKSDVRTKLDDFVDGRIRKRDGLHFIKPSHLSNGEGCINVSDVSEAQRDITIDVLEKHVHKFLHKNAAEFESAALRSLRPGFIAQPSYQSVVGFGFPLELRAVALWGRVRVGIWWWGAESRTPHRNVWIMRCPRRENELSDDDGWKLVHRHPGQNPGFDAALVLLLKYMPVIASLTESIAVAVGAPFIRADFFVGSPQWGVRLNEVAYGSGVEYRREEGDAQGDAQRDLVDDGPAIAQILCEGMAQCSSRHAPEHFLSRLGVEGTAYEEIRVNPATFAEPFVESAEQGEGIQDDQNCEVPHHKCHTPRPQCDAGGQNDAPQWLDVDVPDGAKAGSCVTFLGPDGKELVAQVPEGFQVGRRFAVQVVNGVVMQPCQVVVPEGFSAGDEIKFQAPNGSVSACLVPEGLSAGNSFTALAPAPVAELAVEDPHLSRKKRRSRASRSKKENRRGDSSEWSLSSLPSWLVELAFPQCSHETAKKRGGKEIEDAPICEIGFDPWNKS